MMGWKLVMRAVHAEADPAVVRWAGNLAWTAIMVAVVVTVLGEVI
jgi:hypothetical protein